MHCLVLRRPDAKTMEEESAEFEQPGVQSPQQAKSEDFSLPASGTSGFNMATNTSSVFFENSSGSGATSNYGIQALINNVHLGYVTSDQVADANTLDEVDEVGAKYEEDSFPQESEILREWKNKKILELQQRQKESQVKQEHENAQVLEEAAIQRENFYKERAAHIQARRLLNREKEMIYHAHMESRQKLVEGNSWQAVAAYIDLDSEASATTMSSTKVNGKGKVPRPMSPMELVNARRLELKKAKDLPKISKKATDLSRMRQILTKLQQQAFVR